ncbi:MAG: FHA domain-containing protein [Erythrobacter sp.]|nr:MAG: FHA domain-containing protein [Erythrobacter sp.]
MSLALTPIAGSAESGRRIGSGSLLIGRDPRAQLRIDDPTASGRHCVISGQGGDWQIQDFSRNGTFVNGEKLTVRQNLRNGDRIRIAQNEWQAVIDAATDDGGVTYVRAVTPPETPVEHTRAMASQRSSTPATARAAGGVNDRLLGPALEVLAEIARTRKQARSELFGDKPGSSASQARKNSPLADARKGQALATLSAMRPDEAEQAVRQAGTELTAHDAALLAAMQAALHAVLDQFAPSQIQRGGKNDAQAWQAYRAAFEDQDVGFVELFARSFEEEYRKQSG